ncbi:MAG: preprotein translocase subunit SecY [Clostridia bacterium]
MFKTLINAFRIKEVRAKILLTLLLLLVYRVGCFLPVPGINVSVFTEAASEGFLNILSSISGGSLSNGAFLALGVTPYISASIIIQLLSIALPSLEKLARQGEEGRKKMNMYTRIAALVLSIGQAGGIVLSIADSVKPIWSGASTAITSIFVALILVAGGMFTVWLGERISDIGAGNGLSLLIFVGILSSAGASLLSSMQSVFADIENIYPILGFLIAVIVIFALIVFVDMAERKVPVQYAKQMKGRKMYGGQSTYIPIRVNANGVIPIIFASALLTFPQLLMSMFWPTSNAMVWYSQNLGMGSWLNLVLTSVLILFFAFFYSQISFNPEEISKQIQSNGGFIPGIRPGRPTTEQLKKISNRITLFGAIFLAFIALVPSLVFKGVGGTSSLINAFTATGMLIVVSVALEFDKQIQSLILMKQYKGFLK